MAPGTLPFLSTRCLKYQQELASPSRESVFSAGIIPAMFPPTSPHKAFQAFQIIFDKYLSLAHLSYLLKYPGSSPSLPTLAALLAHCRSASTSSSRIWGTTPSTSNATGVFAVTKHPIPDMLYITDIPETAHTVCSPCSQGKSTPPGPELISQCWALNNCAWYAPWAPRSHSHEAFIFFVWGVGRNRKGVWREKESLRMIALNLHANRELPCSHTAPLWLQIRQEREEH